MSMIYRCYLENPNMMCVFDIMKDARYNVQIQVCNAKCHM